MAPGTCFLFKHLKKNKHLSEKAGDFFLCWPHDVKQGLWTLSPYRTDTYRQREKKRKNIANVENTKEVHKKVNIYEVSRTNNNQT